jgi:hypothetical protein
LIYIYIYIGKQKTWKKLQKKNISDDDEEQGQSVAKPRIECPPVSFHIDEHVTLRDLAKKHGFRLPAASATSGNRARGRFYREKSNKKHMNEAGKFVDFWIPMMSLFSSDDMLFKPKKYADVKELVGRVLISAKFNAYKIHGPMDSVGKTYGEDQNPTLWIYKRIKALWLSDHQCRRGCLCHDQHLCSFHFRFTSIS